VPRFFQQAKQAFLVADAQFTLRRAYGKWRKGRNGSHAYARLQQTASACPVLIVVAHVVFPMERITLVKLQAALSPSLIRKQNKTNE
jgi:hypothetical protein